MGRQVEIGLKIPRAAQGQTPTWPITIRWLIEALHHSRRLQAQRFLVSHRHLIDAREEGGPSSPGGEKDVDR